MKPFISIVLFGLSNLALPGAQGPPQPPRYSVHDLGTLHGGFSTVARSINNSGHVAGSATSAGGGSNVEGPYHPFLFTHGRIQDLGLLPGYDWGSTERINDRGQILVYQYVLGAPGFFQLPTPFLYTD